jgi:hypothetical protein
MTSIFLLEMEDDLFFKSKSSLVGSAYPELGTALPKLVFTLFFLFRGGVR